MDQTFISNTLSITLILVTVIYVFYTGRMAADNRKMLRTVSEQYRETIRPFVIARLGFYEGVVFTLEIENLGKSTAKNLRISIDKDFYPVGENRNIRDYAIFSQNIAGFSPAEKVTVLLSQGFNMDNVKNDVDLTPSQFAISLTHDFQDQSYADSFNIDASIYYSTVAIKNSAEHLKAIADQLKKIADNQSKAF